MHTDKPAALAELLERIPSVKEIKSKLESGARLQDVGAPPGAITALRWVVGSCRAYLKETKPGQGVVNDLTMKPNRYAGYGSTTADQVRQFTFVVGSPEQENCFKAEIKAAQKADKNCVAYPTMLAFHGMSDVHVCTRSLHIAHVARRLGYSQVAQHFANRAGLR